MSDETGSSATKFRALSGSVRLLERLLFGGVAVWGLFWGLGVQHRLPWTFFNQQYLGLFLALGLGSIFVAVKAYPKEIGDRVPWYDWFFAFAGIVIGLYVAVFYPIIAYRLAELSPERWILGGLAVVLVLEAARRVAGGTLAWIALA